MTNERTNLPSASEMVDAWVKSATETERRWNEYLNQVMGTDAFAQWMARTMETNAAIQAAFARGMEQYLRAFNIPTQGDLARLAERLTAVEQRLDSLEAAGIDAGADGGVEQPTGTRRSRGRRKQGARATGS